MPATATETRARLPAKWVDEMARAPRSPTLPQNALPSHENRMQSKKVGQENESLNHGFDARLDDFLSRFHSELVAARAAKDVGDASEGRNADATNEFRARMQRVQDMYAAEGKDFADALERRNPAFATATANYGENTLELARGIERLERAVRDEESKRAAGKDPAASQRMKPLHDQDREKSGTRKIQIAERTGDGNRRHLVDQQRKPKRQAGRSAKSFDVGYAALSSAIPTTAPPSLSNLHSDETLCLMQSDIQALKLELMRLQRSKAVAGGAMRSGPSIPSSVAGDLPFTSSTVSPGGSGSGNDLSSDANGQPRYVSHLEQMKSRLDALERKPLSRPNRKRSQVRIGRTRTITNMYSSSPSHHNLDLQDENDSPNVCSNATPPFSPKCDDSCAAYLQLSAKPEVLGSSNVLKSLGDDDFHSISGSISSSSPSPRPRPAEKMPEKNIGNDVSEHLHSPKARLFSIDAPEDLLSGPQSHAAARDIQRYSLKVARRLGPIPATVSGAMPARSPQDLSTEAVKTSGGTGSAGLSRHGTSRSEMTAPTGNDSRVNGTPEAPSTMDTVNTTGSGGKVVEEMEGDILVRRGNLWKRWRRRYASIVSHQFFGRVLCLFSYDSSGNVISSKSEIIVLRRALCRAVRETVEAGGGTQYIFVLRTSKEYYFASSSEDGRRQWVRELREAARQDESKLTATKSSSDVHVPAVTTKQTRGSSKKATVGRSATHLGTNGHNITHSGNIPLTRSRRGPFRRIGHP